MTETRQTRAPIGLGTPLQYVKGVGPQRATQLAKKGLTTVGDALFHLPLRHEDRTRFTPLRALRPGEVATCSGVVIGLSPPPPGRHRQPLAIVLRDESGYGTATVFGRPWVAGAVVPVYSTTEGLPQQALRSLLWRLVEAHAHEVDETLPDAMRARRHLAPL